MAKEEHIVEIDGIRCEPSNSTYGLLQVSENPSGAPIGIPLCILRGKSDGPTLLVDSSVHGQELTGTLAIKKLLRELRPESLRGTLICAPCVNAPAFDAVARVNILERDPRNMDQVFPGHEEGTLAEMTAHHYYTKVVKKCDAVLSFHTGGPYLCPIDCALLPPSTTPDVDRRAEGIARAFGLRYVWNTLEGPPEYTGSLIEAAARDGIAAVVVEVGCQTAWYDHGNHFVDTSVRGIKNVMKHLGILDGKPEVPSRYLYTKGPVIAIRSRRGGIWETSRSLGERLRKDDLIGRVVDTLTDKELEKVVAPFDGVVFDVRVWPLTYPGELLGHFAAAEERD
jgi:predicted deacylase